MRNKWEAGGRRPLEDWAVNQMAVMGPGLGCGGGAGRWAEPEWSLAAGGQVTDETGRAVAGSSATRQLRKRGGPGRMPGPLRTAGPANRVNRSGHMIFLKKQNPDSFTLPVVYPRCLFFFSSWAISGLTGLRGEQSWSAEPTGGERDQWVKEGLSFPGRLGRVPAPDPQGSWLETLLDVLG